MRRQGHYTDTGVNSMVAGQMQQQQTYPSQQLSGNAYPPQDPLRPGDAHYYVASRPAEGQWHWERDGAKDPNQIPSFHTGYAEGQGKAASHNLYEAKRQDQVLGTEKMGSTDLRAPTPNNSALDGAYEGNTALPQTIEGLEQRFLQDITKLLKEQHDAEDAEFSRHRERLNEINAQYQEKLVALRAKQGNIRDEFLRKDSQSRCQQYQHYQQTNSMAHFQNNTPPPLPSGSLHSYPPAGGYGMEAPQRTAYHGRYSAEGYPGGYSGDAPPRAPYPSTLPSHYESGGNAHGRGFESQYPGGRAHNAGGRQR